MDEVEGRLARTNQNISTAALIIVNKRVKTMEEKNIIVHTNMYDTVETYENCTVQILTNTLTGEVSIGWWHGTKADMPKL